MSPYRENAYSEPLPPCSTCAGTGIEVDIMNWGFASTCWRCGGLGKATVPVPAREGES